MAQLPPAKMDPTSHQAAPAAGAGTTSTSTHYGGINPENEANFPLLQPVSDEGLRADATDRRKMLDSSPDHYYPLPPRTHRTPPLPSSPRNGTCPLLKLPVELVDAVLAYLSPVDLVATSATCRRLHAFATAEIHWLHRVQANVPGVRLTSPHPCATYQELYGAHDPRWFLPRYKIWFCDREMMGKLVVVRYDPRRGCIEGYQLLAVSSRATFHHWPADQNVIIHAFEPCVKLHLDKPVLQFNIRDAHHSPVGTRPGKGSGTRFAAEAPMRFDNQPDLLRCNFMLARPLGADATAARVATPFPYGNVWPPPAIPARHRVAGLAPPSGPDPALLRDADRPGKRAEASDQTFRVRQWMEMAGPSPLPGLTLRQPGRHGGGAAAGLMQMLMGGLHVATRPSQDGTGMSVHLGEEVITYATLDPKLYTPTEGKPWRGIWVGDYSGHGCEFLLVNQPDEEGDDATDAELGLERGFDESEEGWAARRRDARIYRGRLEAIKLTGDHNVPRGEYTFVADDLGYKGFVGVAREEPFAGTRVVRSRGHVAGAGFLDDKYIESQLLLISHDRLAQYWVGFGHISFFERVDIDKFLVP